MFSQSLAPPRLRGITWSTVRWDVVPQYWHVHESRANTARRVMRRRALVARDAHVGDQPDHDGMREASCSPSAAVRSPCSSSSAFSFSTSTTARRTVQTFSGS